MDKKTLIIFTIIFFIVQVIGTIVSMGFSGLGLEATLINEDPNDVINAIALIIYILVMTGVILILIKYKKSKNIFWIFEILAVWTTTALVIGLLIGDYAMIIATILILARLKWKKNIWIKNIAALMAVVGAGALIGISLGIIPIIVFVILLSIYDLIAVFGTKHMITMAKTITKENMAFTFTFPTKKREINLGTGDLVIPLAVIAATINSTQITGIQNTFLAGIIVAISAYIGLVMTIWWVSKKEGRALPALPPQTALMVITIIILILIGI